MLGHFDDIDWFWPLCSWNNGVMLSASLLYLIVWWEWGGEVCLNWRRLHATCTTLLEKHFLKTVLGRRIPKTKIYYKMGSQMAAHRPNLVCQIFMFGPWLVSKYIWKSYLFSHWTSVFDLSLVRHGPPGNVTGNPCTKIFHDCRFLIFICQSWQAP